MGGVLTSLAGIILLFFVPLISLFALPVGVFLLVMSIFVVKSTKDAATNTKKLLKLLTTDKHKSKADELRALYDEYVRFELLCAAFEKDEEHRKIRAVETERLALAADEFLSRYKTQSEHPFDEILGYLNERSAILSSLSELSEIPNFDYSSEDTRGAQTESPKSVFEAIVKEQSRLEGEREHARRRMLTLEGELQREDFIICAVEENKERLDLYTKNLFYIQKSKEFLETARDNMTAKYLGKAKSAFEGYMAQLSQNTGEYMLDTSFEISKNEYGTLKKSEAYSLGIRNMQHLAIRLAIIDALYENESPFIILDDPLISFDDERAALAAELLRKLSKRRQIIYFTCSASRGIG